MFIVAFYSTTVTILCVISGALVQYFLLATFLYLKLVVVLGARIESYALKVAIVAWGTLQEFSSIWIYLVIPSGSPYIYSYGTSHLHSCFHPGSQLS